MIKVKRKSQDGHPIFLIGAKPKLCKKRLTCLTAPVKGTLARTFREMLRNPFVPVNHAHLFSLLIHSLVTNGCLGIKMDNSNSTTFAGKRSELSFVFVAITVLFVWDKK